MPKFVEQAATYSYDKTSTYIDTACERLPLVQRVVTCLVPYAKPSVELADRIVDRVLGLASKPKDFVQGTASSVNTKVVHCKAALVTKIVDARDFASDKTSGIAASATETLQKYRSLAAEKRTTMLQMLQELKVSAYEKFSTTLHTVATRLHLIGVWEMACSKGNAGKSYVMGVKDRAYQKGSAAKNDALALVGKVVGKAYLFTGKVVGKTRVDYVVGVVAKYTPAKIQTIVEAMHVNTGSEVEPVSKAPVTDTNVKESSVKQSNGSQVHAISASEAEVADEVSVMQTSVKKSNAISEAEVGKAPWSKRNTAKNTHANSGNGVEVVDGAPMKETNGEKKTTRKWSKGSTGSTGTGSTGEAGEKKSK